MASARSLRSKRRQTRLQFQPLPSSSPAKGHYSQAIQDRLAKVSYEGAKPLHLTTFNDEDRTSLPTPEPSSQAKTTGQEIAVTSPLTSLRTSPAPPPRFANLRSDSSSGSEDDIVLPSSKRRRLSHPQVQKDDFGARSIRQSRNVPLSTPTRRSFRLQKSSSPASRFASSPSNRRAVSKHVASSTAHLSGLGSAETSDDDEVMMTQPGTRRNARRSKPSEHDTFVVSDDDDQYRSPDHGKVTAKSRKKDRRIEDDFVVNNDEVEYITSNGEDEPQQTDHSKGYEKSQRSRPLKTPKHRSRREQKELAEDLLDLQDSDPDAEITRSRTRGGPVTTQRDKAREHLNLLKKRRAGQRGFRVIDSDDDIQELEDSRGADIDDIDREIDDTHSFSQDDVFLDETHAHDQHPIYVDDDDDDFVVEDTITEGRLGRPNTDIPLQFTSFASAEPKELFVHIIEWMVKNKISPAFNRNDDVYSISFARIDDQVKAQAGSRLISSAWNATFKHAVLARPHIHVTALPGLDEDHIRTCDACNRSNHPARYDFTFSGKAYIQATLEPVEDSDEDEEDADDTISHDEQGHQLASENTHFYLGRFCAANAEMGHKLTHWKNQLNEQVLAYLEEQGVLSAEAIVSRDRLNKKKREKEAESIVDMMQDTGMISEIWQAFQDDLEDARIGMEGHERKGGRSKARIGSVRVQRDDGVIGEWVEGSKFKRVGRIESDSEGD